MTADNPRHWPASIVPDDVPTAEALVQMGLARVRETRQGKVYVIDDAGHRLLGTLLRERGRR